jgi:hypothetical protein
MRQRNTRASNQGGRVSRYARFLISPAVIAGLSFQVWACDPMAPTASLGVRPQFQATHSEITGSFEEVDDPADCTANPRIGEIVLFTGRINYVLRATTTPSGNVDTTLKFIYDPAVHLVGQTSGTVWMIDPTNTRPIFILRVHGNGLVTQNVGQEFYTNAAGAHLLLMANYHVTVNANGNVTASRDFLYDCIGG